MITYRENTHIDKDGLYTLFQSAGWIQPFGQKKDQDKSSDCIANHTLYLDEGDPENLIQQAFENSDYVVSAWDDENFIGIVRVLSDKVQRSIIYDLAVLPKYQGQGIGKELIKKCLDKFPKTQFTLGTSSKNFGFYRKIGFTLSHNYLEKESNFF